jgi:transposase IS66-like protein
MLDARPVVCEAWLTRMMPIRWGAERQAPIALYDAFASCRSQMVGRALRMALPCKAWQLTRISREGLQTTPLGSGIVIILAWLRRWWVHCSSIVHGPSCTCSASGGEMRKVGEDVTRILGYIPGHFEVIRRVRLANFLFAGPDAGGERAAAAYTLIESAKLNGSRSRSISAPGDRRRLISAVSSAAEPRELPAPRSCRNRLPV